MKGVSSMDTLGKRIKKVIVHHGATMTSFAKELNISQSMVSKICGDKAIPSDRTISDICRIFNVRKDWLLYGTGEMVDENSLKAELDGCFDKTLSDEIKNAFISILVNTPPVAWSLIADYLGKIAEEYKKHPNEASTYIDGYKAGAHLSQIVNEMIENLPDEPEK